MNLAAGEWVDELGLTWLLTPPKIKLLPYDDKRPPYPLNWAEQERLFRELPDHLGEMALFAVNTGCRDSEICNLRWDYETPLTMKTIRALAAVPSTRVSESASRLSRSPRYTCVISEITVRFVSFTQGSVCVASVHHE